MKHYRAHLAPIVAISASADGQLFASVAEDGSAKMYDVVNFGGSQVALLLRDRDVLILLACVRYDKYDSATVYSTYVLLGSSERASPGPSRNVKGLYSLSNPPD